jgi:hypothetical protein
MSVRRPLSAVGVLAGAAALLLAGCAGSDAETSGTVVDVTAGDDTCEVAERTLEAGAVTFRVENTGSEVTEVYVYGRNGKEFDRIVDEVEDIGPGTSRDMSLELEAGSYEIACKPGQTGDGIRTPITVESGE